MVFDVMQTEQRILLVWFWKAKRNHAKLSCTVRSSDEGFAGAQIELVVSLLQLRCKWDFSPLRSWQTRWIAFCHAWDDIIIWTVNGREVYRLTLLHFSSFVHRFSYTVALQVRLSWAALSAGRMMAQGLVSSRRSSIATCSSSSYHFRRWTVAQMVVLWPLRPSWY